MTKKGSARNIISNSFSRTDCKSGIYNLNILEKSFRNIAEAKNSNEQKYVHVFLWKQNDFGVFGRRIDMIAKELGRYSSTCDVIVFEKLISSFDFDKHRDSHNDHYQLLFEELAAKINGKIYYDNVFCFTPMVKAGLSGEEIRSQYGDMIENVVAERIMLKINQHVRPRLSYGYTHMSKIIA